MARKKQKPNFRKYILWFWLLMFIPVLFGTGVIFAAKWGWMGPMPNVEQLQNPKSLLATEIIAYDGEVIGKFFVENRTNVDFDNISPFVIQALIATEDERYEQHSGIDFRSLARAIAKLGKAGGASTITQQLAKMLFTEDVARSKFQRVWQKVKEWVIAVELERLYTKEEIIALYLNRYDFVNLAVGIESASKIYFNTTPDSLRVEEAAVLVGMLKNASLYDPRARPEMVTDRRNTVFGQMVRNDFLSQEEADSLSLIPLELDYQPASHNSGIGTYFREHVRQFMHEWVKTHKKPDGTEYNLYTDGLKIYTSIDSRMQQHAEQAVNRHMKNLQGIFFDHWEGRKNAPFSDLSKSEIDRIIEQTKKRSYRYISLKRNGMSTDSIDILFNMPTRMSLFSWDGYIDTTMTPLDSIRYMKYFLQVGMMSMEPQTGFVKAWVGGIDYRAFKYDHVYESRRQVGSTFKPFVYATAIDQKGYSPCYKVANVPVRFEKEEWGLLKDWQPVNSDGEYGGEVTLKEGLANSMNTITAFLMKQVKPSAVIRMAKQLGVESEIPNQPAIALGTPDLSVYEMVGAYGTFANGGIYTEPITVLRIEDKYGVVLDEFMPNTREVMSQETAYVICDLLKGVTQSGTGIRLKTRGSENNYSYLGNPVTGYPYAFTNPIAGKTGTTQNHSDGWFMGMVPNLVTGVWVGAEDRAIHFRDLGRGQGATMALPIWALYMKSCYADDELEISDGDFQRPEGELSIELDCNKFEKSQNSGSNDQYVPEF
jgi:penicillin-binding protein 1A